MWREAAEVRVVVARHERLDEIEDLRDRRSVDRNEATADERGVRGVHDVEPVRKVVETEWVQVELPGMRRIAREEPRVPVPRAEQRDEPKHTDEQLVAGEARSAPREPVHFRLEALFRNAPKRVRVNLLDRPTELADIVGGRDGSGRSSLRPGDEHDHGKWHERAGPASAWPGMMSYLSYMSRLTY